MASIPGSHYEIFAPGQTVNFGLTYDANSFAPPVPGEFNLEVIINATGTGNYPTPPGYQGVLIESVPGKTIPPTVTMLHGDYGLMDAGAMIGSFWATAASRSRVRQAIRSPAAPGSTNSSTL